MSEKREEFEKANQGKRFSAYLVDWFLGGLVIMFPISIYYLQQTHDLNSLRGVSINTIVDQFGTEQGIFISAIAIIGGLVYYVLIPMVMNGQTLGKKMFDLKIVTSDGNECSNKVIVIRQLVVLIGLETYLYSVSHLIIYFLELTLKLELLRYVYSVGILISGLSCILVAFTHEHLAIHDMLSKTKVVGVVNRKTDERI